MFGLYKDVAAGRVTLGSMNFSPNFSPNRVGVDQRLLRANRHQLITRRIRGGYQTNIQYQDRLYISRSTNKTYQTQLSVGCRWYLNYFYNEGSLQSKVIFLSLTMRVQMSTCNFLFPLLNILYLLINVFWWSINSQTVSNYHHPLGLSRQDKTSLHAGLRALRAMPDCDILREQSSLLETDKDNRSVGDGWTADQHGGSH